MRVTKRNIHGEAIDNEFSEKEFQEDGGLPVAIPARGRRLSPLIVKAWSGTIPVFDEVTQMQKRYIRGALRTALTFDPDQQRLYYLYVVADTSSLGVYKGISYTQPMLSVYAKPPFLYENSKEIRYQPNGFIAWMNSKQAFELFLSRAIYRVNPKDYFTEKELKDFYLAKEEEKKNASNR